MPASNQTYDVGLFYGSTLYQKERCFELDRQYEVVKKYNSELGKVIYALMDADTFCGCLTDKAVGLVSHLFQPGHKVLVEVYRVHPMSSHFSPTLNRNQVIAHGRGTCWSEADEQGE